MALGTLFRSLGNDATGTLNAWATDAGSPSISSNVATIPSNAQMRAGHADWWDGVALVRFTWATNSNLWLITHANTTGGLAGTSGVYAFADGTNLVCGKLLAGAATSLTTNAAALTNGTSYWLEISASGTSYTAKIYADSAGARGALIQTSAATVVDASVQAGQVALRNTGSASVTAGGAFANVCTVNGPIPTGWTFNANGGWTLTEPAGCWSKAQAFQGNYSLSVFNQVAGGQGFWQATVPTVAATAYIASGQLRGTGTPTSFFIQLGAFNAGNAVADSTWRLYSVTATPGASTTMSLVGYGVGTYYFDNVNVFQGTTPVFTDGLERLAQQYLGALQNGLGGYALGVLAPANRPVGGGS